MTDDINKEEELPIEEERLNPEPGVPKADSDAGEAKDLSMQELEDIRKDELGEELPVKSVIESLLFVSDSPLSTDRISQLVGKPQDEVIKVTRELMDEYDSMGHSFKIVEIAEGFQMCTRHEYAPWIKMLYASKNRATLSRPALEVLAIIAYKQPLTRAEIEMIRGVDSSGVLATLLEKKLVKIAGRKKVLGRPLLYRTTDEFLIYFGLKDLEELPKVEELRGIV